MTNRKGPDYETAVTNWLQAHGWPYAKRLVKEGAKDKGDVALGDGIPITIECKNEAKLDLAAGQHELAAEMANNGHVWGFTVHKRKGTTNVGVHYAVLPVEILMDILDNVSTWPHQEQRRSQVRQYFGQPEGRRSPSTNGPSAGSVRPKVKKRSIPR